MTDTTVTTESPGPTRSPTGELLPPGTTTPTPPATPETQTPPSGTETKVETKTEDGKTVLNKDVKTEAPAGAPETYADFKVPDGFQLDPAVAKEAGTLFKGLNLSQDQAQSLIDFHTSKTQAAAEAPFKLWADTQKEWTDTVKSKYGRDVEPGGKVLTTTAKLIDSLGPTVAKSFREAMDITGV